MAEINNKEQLDKTKKPNAKKHSTRIDMTPMVDLAFLLLTFFMLTTTFNKPKSLLVNMPVPEGDSTPVPDNTVTILVGAKNKLTFYQGIFDAGNASKFHQSDFTQNGIRKNLLELNQTLVNRISEIENDYSQGIIDESTYKKKVSAAMKDKDNKGIFVIIKAADDASYQSLVRLLDEMKICNVVNYAIVDITKEEEKILALR